MATPRLLTAARRLSLAASTGGLPAALPLLPGPGFEAEGAVVVPGDHGHLVGLLRPPQEGVVSGPGDVVEVVDDVLEGQIGDHLVDVDPLRQPRLEIGVAGFVDELQELDQRGEVRLPGFLVEDVLVGRLVGAAVGVVAGGFRLVQQPRDVEVLRHPGFVEVLAGQPQHRVGAVDAEADVGGLLAGQPGFGEQVEGHRLVQGGGRRAGADHHAGHAVVVRAVDELVESHQPRQLLWCGVGGDSLQGRVSLQLQPGFFVRNPVDGDRRLDPVLGPGRGNRRSPFPPFRWKHPPTSPRMSRIRSGSPPRPHPVPPPRTHRDEKSVS